MGDSPYFNVSLLIDETYPIEGQEIINNSDIIRIEDGLIVAQKPGKATITVDGCDKDVEVIDLYTLPKLNNNKPYLLCNEYTYEENIELDRVLVNLINSAGYKTRAGVVEAARFLTLRFKNKLSYFYENGRFGNDGMERRIADGEGRYYHEGLYLSEEKMNGIAPVNNGPAIWGCDLLENYNEQIKANSLDCSGFICWAMYNAGYDIGDIGAGPDEDSYDLTDVGEFVYLDEIDLNTLKVGDLVGLDGHVGIIIGIDSSNIYVAHMYWEGDLQVSSYPLKEFDTSMWEYAMLMDSYYQNDGNLTNYWN